jgi:hypothetical protein
LKEWAQEVTKNTTHFISPVGNLRSIEVLKIGAKSNHAHYIGHCAFAKRAVGKGYTREGGLWLDSFK